MELTLPSKYYCKRDNCIGIETSLGTGGTAVAFNFWNRYIAPEDFELGDFPTLLRRLRMGPVDFERGTDYVSVVLTVGPTKYNEFRKVLKDAIWEAYRNVYNVNKKLR